MCKEDRSITAIEIACLRDMIASLKESQHDEEHAHIPFPDHRTDLGEFVRVNIFDFKNTCLALCNDL
eukprot:1153509-Pelagomonas_calceolata.AAC.10